MAGRSTLGRWAVALGYFFLDHSHNSTGEARRLPGQAPAVSPAWHQESCQAGGMGTEESNSFERLVSRPN